MEIVTFKPDMQQSVDDFFSKCFSAAQHLYRSSGFQETEKYNDNDCAELYFELIL